MADNGVVNLDGLVNTMKTANQNMSLLITTISGLFPRITGTFTMAAAATKVVTEPNIISGSIVQLIAANSAAGVLQGSNEYLYWNASANVPGASFTVATAAGTAAAGTELFYYIVFNPV
jgi:hypothetical protein